jgi:hypothetical protein
MPSRGIAVVRRPGRTAERGGGGMTIVTPGRPVTSMLLDALSTLTTQHLRRSGGASRDQRLPTGEQHPA